VTVGSRAAQTTDQEAQGINFNKGKLDVGIDPRNPLEIDASDWNTIDGASFVPICIPVEIDPTFSVDNRTTLNRFQYLADRISLYPAQNQIDSYYITTAKNGTALGIIIAFRNETQKPQALFHLHVELKESPPPTTVVDIDIPEKQFDFTVQPKAIYFREIYIGSFAAPPSSATKTSSSISVSNHPAPIGN